MNKLFDVVVNIDVNVRGAMQKLAKFTTDLETRFTRFSKQTRALSREFTDFQMKGTQALFAMTIAFGALINAGSRFEKGMSGVKAAMGELRTGTALAESKFQELSNTALKLGASTTFTATQAAEGMRLLALAGFSAEETIGAIGSTLRLAEAGMLNLARASEITANNVRAFQLAAVDAARVADVLAATAANADTTIDGLGESFKFAAPVAAALGQSIEDTAVTLGVLANAGLKNTISGTALAQILGKLSKEAGKADDILRQYGSSFEAVDPQMVSIIDIVKEFSRVNVQAGDVLRLFEARAGRAFLSLMSQGTEAFDTLSDSIENSFGETFEQALTRMENFAGAVKIMFSQIEAISIRVFNTYRVELTGFVRQIQKTLLVIEEFVQQNKETVISFIKMGAAFFIGTAAATGLAIALNSLISAIVILGRGVKLVDNVLLKMATNFGLAEAKTKTFAAALGKLPFFSILLLPAAIKAVYDNFDALVQIVKDLADIFVTIFGPAIGLITEAYLAAFENTVKAITAAIRVLQNVIAAVKKQIDELFGAGVPAGESGGNLLSTLIGYVAPLTAFAYAMWKLGAAAALAMAKIKDFISTLHVLRLLSHGAASPLKFMVSGLMRIAAIKFAVVIAGLTALSAIIARVYKWFNKTDAAVLKATAHLNAAASGVESLHAAIKQLDESNPLSETLKSIGEMRKLLELLEKDPSQLTPLQIKNLQSGLESISSPEAVEKAFADQLAVADAQTDALIDMLSAKRQKASAALRTLQKAYTEDSRLTSYVNGTKDKISETMAEILRLDKQMQEVREKNNAQHEKGFDASDMTPEKRVEAFMDYQTEAISVRVKMLQELAKAGGEAGQDAEQRLQKLQQIAENVLLKVDYKELFGQDAQITSVFERMNQEKEKLGRSYSEFLERSKKFSDAVKTTIEEAEMQSTELGKALENADKALHTFGMSKFDKQLHEWDDLRAGVEAYIESVRRAQDAAATMEEVKIQNAQTGVALAQKEIREAEQKLKQARIAGGKAFNEGNTTKAQEWRGVEAEQEAVIAKKKREIDALNKNILKSEEGIAAATKKGTEEVEKLTATTKELDAARRAVLLEQQEEAISTVNDAKIAELEANGELVAAAELKAQEILATNRKFLEENTNLNKQQQQELTRIAENEAVRTIEDARKKQKKEAQARQDYIGKLREDNLKAEGRHVDAQIMENKRLLAEERARHDELGLNAQERAEAEMALRRKMQNSLNEAREKEQEDNKEKERTEKLMDKAVENVAKQAQGLMDLVRLNGTLLQIEMARARFEEAMADRKVARLKEQVQLVARLTERQARLTDELKKAEDAGSIEDTTRIQRDLRRTQDNLAIAQGVAEGRAGVAGITLNPWQQQQPGAEQGFGARSACECFEPVVSYLSQISMNVSLIAQKIASTAEGVPNMAELDRNINLSGAMPDGIPMPSVGAISALAGFGRGAIGAATVMGATPNTAGRAALQGFGEGTKAVINVNVKNEIDAALLQSKLEAVFRSVGIGN
jgi:TP901 family phage tail tape measure protein